MNLLLFKTTILFWLSGFEGVAVCLPFLFFGLIIAIIVGIFVISHQREKKRLLDLQNFAAQNGWSVVSNAVKENFQNWDSYTIFSSGHSKRILGFLQKNLDGGQMFAFDYQYTVGHGKQRRTHTQTIFAFHTPHLNIPYFALYPESFFSFIGEMFGYNDIDFVSHPNFSKRYKLTGRDEGPIRQVFHPQMLSTFEQLPNVNVDGGGNYLFVYTTDQRIKIENLSGYINNSTNVYGLFRR